MADHFDVFMLTLGPLGANCFILACDGRALVIDPGDEGDVVAAAFDEIGARPAGHPCDARPLRPHRRRRRPRQAVRPARLRGRGRRGAARRPGERTAGRICRRGGLGRAHPARRQNGSSTWCARDGDPHAGSLGRLVSVLRRRSSVLGRPAVPGQRRAHRPARRLDRPAAQLDRRRSSAGSRPTRSCTAATGPTRRWAASSRSTPSCRRCATTRSTAGERPEGP